MSSKISISFLIILSSVIFVAFKKFNQPYIISSLTKTGLKDVSKFPIGAAINPNLIKTDIKYSNTVVNEFNSITSENSLKWIALRPTISKYNFVGGDFISDYAKKNNLRLHGHCLVWNGSTPNWLKEFKGDSIAWEGLMKDHIETVVKHFKGKVRSWDVVNEAFDSEGGLRVGFRMFGFNDNYNYWSSHLGKDYIARAFTYAHRADPNALLFYNDNGQEKSVKKSIAILNMVNGFKKRGIPIHGLGLQMHLTINSDFVGITKALEIAAQSGLKIHISELDIRLNLDRHIPFHYTNEAYIKQAKLFNFVAKMYKKIVPLKQQYGITFWNVGDKDSWVRNHYHTVDYPLLFDEKYQRKGIYVDFVKGLKDR